MRMNLYGPAQGETALHTVVPAERWNWVGSAATASTKTLFFSNEYPGVRRARALVVWQAPTVQYYVGIICWPTDYSEPERLLAYAQSSGNPNPRSIIINLTQQMQNLVDNQQDVYIGFKVWGDGVTQIWLNEVRIEIDFEI